MGTDPKAIAVTDNGGGGDGALNQLRLGLEITELDLRALTLAFDLEFWGREPGLAAELGEAAFQVTLEVDAGGGLVPLTDLDTASTGRTMNGPGTILMDGNAPANRVHFDSGVIDAPVAVGTTLAVALTIPPEDDIGTGFIYGVDNVRVRSLSPGDSNGDGSFDTADLVQVLQAGEYEDEIDGNSTWIEGDWNGDGDFDTADLVAALQSGRYERTPERNGRKTAAAVDWLLAQDARATRRPAYVA